MSYSLLKPACPQNLPKKQRELLLAQQQESILNEIPLLPPEIRKGVHILTMYLTKGCENEEEKLRISRLFNSQEFLRYFHENKGSEFAYFAQNITLLITAHGLDNPICKIIFSELGIKKTTLSFSQLYRFIRINQNKICFKNKITNLQRKYPILFEKDIFRMEFLYDGGIVARPNHTYTRTRSKNNSSLILVNPGDMKRDKSNSNLGNNTKTVESSGAIEIPNLQFWLKFNQIVSIKHFEGKLNPKDIEKLQALIDSIKLIAEFCFSVKEFDLNFDIIGISYDKLSDLEKLLIKNFDIDKLIKSFNLAINLYHELKSEYRRANKINQAHLTQLRTPIVDEVFSTCAPSHTTKNSDIYTDFECKIKSEQDKKGFKPLEFTIKCKNRNCELSSIDSLNAIFDMLLRSYFSIYSQFLGVEKCQELFTLIREIFDSKITNSGKH